MFVHQFNIFQKEYKNIDTFALLLKVIKFDPPPTIVKNVEKYELEIIVDQGIEVHNSFPIFLAAMSSSRSDIVTPFVRCR